MANNNDKGKQKASDLDKTGNEASAPPPRARKGAVVTQPPPQEPKPYVALLLTKCENHNIDEVKQLRSDLWELALENEVDMMTRVVRHKKTKDLGIIFGFNGRNMAQAKKDISGEV
jgi:hypothetical protein